MPNVAPPTIEAVDTVAVELEEPMVAVAPELVVQVPPGTSSDKVIVLPEQISVGPLMLSGMPVTVMGDVA